MGVCGSIACIESPKIAREFMRHGAEVTVVMSKSAQKIITPWAFECITGKKTITEITGVCEHVEYCGEHKGRADFFVISPATANTLSKVANGIDDTAVTTFATTAIGSGMSVILAPAMHKSMYKNAFVSENLAKLEKSGIKIVKPEMEEGKAKLGWMKTVDAVLSF